MTTTRDASIAEKDARPTVTTAPSSTAEVRDIVADALAAARAGSRGDGLRIIGAGSWLGAGRPVTAERGLSVARLAGIVDYVPGDFTLTARAGTPLAEIAAVARAERQLLPLDPFGTPSGTIGATVATASAGPLAHAFGPPRDNVLGVETVTGTAGVVRGGGRVVKNVAGFDLTRLFVGAWGTLCVVTEVSIRMRALPAVDETLAVTIDSGGGPSAAPAVAALARAVRDGPLAPLAFEVLNGALAKCLGLDGSTVALIRLAGNGAAVSAQRRALAAIGETTPVSGDVWDRLRNCEPRAAAVFRLSRAPALLAESWALADGIVEPVPGALVHASPGRGVVRCIVPDAAGDALDRVVRAAVRAPVTCIVERIPTSLWALVPARAAHDRLPRAVKQCYDPMGILNPGILGEAVLEGAPS